jgi:hypothetical protein
MLMTPDGTPLAEVPVDMNSWSYFKKETRNYDKISDLIKTDKDAIIHDGIITGEGVKLEGILIHY